MPALAGVEPVIAPADGVQTHLHRIGDREGRLSGVKPILPIGAAEGADWPGWRRHAPAAGSAVVHLAALGLMAATLGAASGAPAASAPDAEEFLAIDLVSLPPEEIIPLEAGVTPPRVQAPRPATPDTAPVLPNTRRTQQAPGAPTTPGAVADEDSVYLPPSVLLRVLPDIAAMGCDELWLNPGTESEEVLAEAERLGLNVVQACSIVGVGVSPGTL